MSDRLMTIREMCDAFGVTARTLRFYEARELISPQRRGQHRLYDRRDRARLTLILRAKHFGFSLEQARQLLELYEPDGTNLIQLAALLEAGQERLAELEQQYAKMGTVIVDLRERIKDAEGWLADAQHAASRRKEA